MITHLSYSSLALFCHNRSAWDRKYNQGIRDNKTTPAALVGVAFHVYADHRLRAYMPDEAATMAHGRIQQTAVEDIDFGKTGSYEKMERDLEAHMLNFETERPEFSKLVGSEIEYLEKVKGIPIPLKGILDAVYLDEVGRLCLWDWKTCSGYDETLTPAHIVQACIYYLLAAKALGQKPYKMVFCQLKASKNTDGSPQLKPLEFVFGDHTQYIRTTKKIINMALKEMRRKSGILPNLRDTYDGEASWEAAVEAYGYQNKMHKMPQAVCDDNQNQQGVDGTLPQMLHG